MNIAWWILRPFYLLGLILVVPVALIACFSFKRDPEVASLLIAGGAFYLAIGYVLLVIAPKMLKRRLDRLIAPYKRAGFAPRYEAVSVLYNRYVGFDSVAKKALYVDVGTGGVLVDFDQVDSWELIPDKSPHPLLKLVTRLPELREIGVRIRTKRLGVWKADMHTLFG
jgi:hypothetical protein